MNGLVSDNWSERVPAGEARPDASDTRRRASGMIPYWYAIHQSYASIHGLTSVPLPVWGGTDLLDGPHLLAFFALFDSVGLCRNPLQPNRVSISPSEGALQYLPSAAHWDRY